MIKRFILFFLQLQLINCFNFQKTIGSLLLSTALMNNNLIEEPHLPEARTQMVINKIANADTSENYQTNIKVNNNNIYFYGPITSESCRELAEVLINMDTSSKIFKADFGIEPPPINLHIQSGGGSLMNAFYVIDLIDNLKTPVYTYVDGYVASAGSLISVMGKKRYMTDNSFIMIHQLSSSLGEGKFNYLDDNMDNLNKFMETITKIYLKKTKIPESQLENILEHDLWMNSKECLEYGLIDEIL